MESGLLFESSPIGCYDEQGVLVGGAVDYDLVDLKDGTQVKIKNSDYRMKNILAQLEAHTDTVKSLLEDLKSQDFKLKSESLNTRAMEEVELCLFLYQQHNEKYKPVVLDKEDVISELMPILKECVTKTESTKDAYKIDFLYYDSHTLPFSLRIEGGKIHVFSIDYIQYPNLVIQDVFKMDSDLKDRFVYHYFSPEKQMQTDGVSCAVHACYALKEIAALSTQDLLKIFSENEEIASSDFQKLNPNLIRLCQVVSVLDKFIEKHPNVKITHKKKSDELLSDYIKRHTYEVVTDVYESDDKVSYKIVKTNVAVYKKALKILEASIKFIKGFSNDKEFFNWGDEVYSNLVITPIKYA